MARAVVPVRPAAGPRAMPVPTFSSPLSSSRRIPPPPPRGSLAFIVDEHTPIPVAGVKTVPVEGMTYAQLDAIVGKMVAYEKLGDEDRGRVMAYAGRLRAQNDVATLAQLGLLSLHDPHTRTFLTEGLSDVHRRFSVPYSGAQIQLAVDAKKALETIDTHTWKPLEGSSRAWIAEQVRERTRFWLAK
jgi:hypothetical protein